VKDIVPSNKTKDGDSLQRSESFARHRSVYQDVVAAHRG
jgi:hypothetical protein